MIKPITSICSLVLFLSVQPIGAQQTNIRKTDLALDGLHGKVKQVKQNKYAATGKIGNVVQGAKEISSQNYSCLYNEMGNTVEANYYMSDGSVGSRYVCKYNLPGDLIESSVYNSDGSLDYKAVYKYDEKGVLMDQSWYNIVGTLFSKSTYKYDEKGNLIEENLYNEGGILEETASYKYDNDGNLIEESSRDNRATYKYDDKKNVVEKMDYDGSDDEIGMKRTYIYDDKGNQSESNTYHSDGSLYLKNMYKYDFDQQGNWTRKTEFENEAAVSITIRAIEYY